MSKQFYDLPCMCIGGWCGCGRRDYYPYLKSYIHYKFPQYKFDNYISINISKTVQPNESNESNESNKSNESDEPEQPKHPEITVEEATNQIKSCEEQINDFPSDYMRIAFGSKYRPYSERLKSKHNHKRECLHYECVLKKLQQVIIDYHTYSEYVVDNIKPFSKVSQNKTRLAKKEHHTESYVLKKNSKLCQVSNKSKFYKKNKNQSVLNQENNLINC